MFVAPGESLSYAHAYADSLGGIEAIRTVAEGNGLGVRLLYTYFEASSHRYIGYFVLDFSKCSVRADDLARKLGQISDVSQVSVPAPKTGLVAIETNFLNVVGTPVTVMARQFLGETFRQVVEANPDTAEKTLFEAGRAAGQQAASGVPGLVQNIGTKLSPALIRERFHDVQVFGWGKLAVLRVDDRFAGDALFTDDFEALAWNGQSNTSRCHWLRGFLTGAVSSLTGSPVDVSEPECQAKGDAHCRMVFRPRD